MQDTHFLRPALTKHIIQRLQRGESLNLFGKPGFLLNRIDIIGNKFHPYINKAW